MDIHAQRPLIPSSQRAFRLFLVISVTLHAGAFLYKKRHIVFIPTSKSRNFSQSLRVQIQESKVTQKVSKVQKERSLKKVTKKKIAKKAPAKAKPNEQIIKKQRLATSPQFESVIRNYEEPRYPRLAIRRGITGKVMLSLKVLGSGKIKEVLITQSSGHDLLDNSVLQAAKSWDFNQLSKNSQEIYSINKTVVFKLN